MILSYHENGQPHEVMFFDSPITIDSIGNKIIYRSNGEVHCEGGYKNGIREGLWRCFYTSGMLDWQANFINGKEEGEVFFQREDGSWRKSYTKNGVLEGPILEYNIDENGNPYIVKGQYTNGLETGRWITSDTLGQKILEETYVEGKVFGECITYYKNGYIQSKGTCINKVLNEKNGNYYDVTMKDTLWYYNGLIEGQIDSFKVIR